MVAARPYRALVDPDDFESWVLVEPKVEYLSGDPDLKNQATIKDGAIRCDICDEPADTIHFTPWVVVRPGDEIQIVAACPNHDPGGYWLRLSELLDDPLHWLLHLGEKRGAPDNALLQWLGYGGVALVTSSRRRGKKTYGIRRCAYCGTTEGPMESDHIVPKSRGGPNQAANRVWACQSCNRRKGTKTLLEWVAELTSSINGEQEPSDA